MLSVQQAQVRKIAANVTPISQERQLLRNWLTSKSPTTQGRGQLTLRRCEQAAKTTHSVPENRSNTPTTSGTANHNESTLNAQVATQANRIRSPTRLFYKETTEDYSILHSVYCQLPIWSSTKRPLSYNKFHGNRDYTTVQLLSPSPPKTKSL